MKNLIYKGIIRVLSIMLSSIIIIGGLIFIEGNQHTIGEVDYLIVLGARLYIDKPSPSLLERLKVAYTYLEQNKDVIVIVSGGQGINEAIPESHAMSQYLVDKGISKDRIIIEDQSTNTFENLSLSLEKIREKDQKDHIKVLIATNKYHILRAKMLAKRLGMVPYGLAAQTPQSVIFKSYVREYFAVIKSLLLDRV